MVDREKPAMWDCGLPGQFVLPHFENHVTSVRWRAKGRFPERRIAIVRQTEAKLSWREDYVKIVEKEAEERQAIGPSYFWRKGNVRRWEKPKPPRDVDREAEMRLIEPVLVSPDNLLAANSLVELNRSTNRQFGKDFDFLGKTFGIGSAEARQQSVILWVDLSGRDNLDPDCDEGGYHYALVTPGPTDPHQITKRDSLGKVIFDRNVMPLPIFSEIMGRGKPAYMEEDLDLVTGEKYLTFSQLVALLNFSFPGKVYVGSRSAWEEMFGIMARDRSIAIPDIARTLDHIFPLSPTAAIEFEERVMTSAFLTANIDLFREIINNLDTPSREQTAVMRKFADEQRAEAAGLTTWLRRRETRIEAVLASGQTSGPTARLESLEISGRKIVIVREPMLANMTALNLGVPLVVGEGSQGGLEYIEERFSQGMRSTTDEEKEVPF
ncbi:hypothetical protein A3D85_02205 [Candidatus Amesbacteria bacterium RIFCSPHIGHO2_02_FULL_47_9]|nr:MAG: hypothetical protein A3D85_02205 [Candidatus Amesbacteria bacterium RIFCSPHIGHO2_02_FULL_47_9]